MAGKGGKRPGAGRKPGSKQLALKDLSVEILSSVDQQKLWLGFLRSKDQRIALEASKYLTDRSHGKAHESVKISGDADNPLAITVRHIGTDN
jgi:hypothetical protein